MKCPYCGSTNLVWDYQRGEVICTYCASVIDKIYVSTKPHGEWGEEHRRSSSCTSDYVPKLKKATKDYLKILETMSSRNRNDITIDTKAFWEYQKTGRRVKLLKRRVNIKYSSDLSVRIAMDVLRKYPKLSSRTDRAKIAIALLAIALVKGAKLNTALITREVGLSKVHIKRLEKLVLKERAFIKELKEAFNRIQ